jgi:hypothetical protein
MPVIGNARLPALMAGILQGEKSRYSLNMEAFLPGDNCRIIAAIFNLVYSGWGNSVYGLKCEAGKQNVSRPLP